MIICSQSNGIGNGTIESSSQLEVPGTGSFAAGALLLFGFAMGC